MSLIVLALYSWAYFGNAKSIGASLLVGNAAAMLACVSVVVAFISYLWTPRNYIFWAALTVYGLLCATTSVLILDTGGTASPFIALWMAVSVFAGIFGAYGLLPLFIALIAYLLLQYTGGTLSREAIIAVVLGGELPLVISYLVWHTKATEEGNDDKAYRKLASELSQVAGKAEVVINAIADGVVALNSQGIIELINPAAQQIIGWGKQDALALDYKSVLQLLDRKDAELTNATDPIAQSLNTNQPITTNNLTLMTNSGKKLLVSVVVSPVGQPGSGVIVVFRDITKEKSEERQQAEFISTASHEMRTPVASIEGYLGLALNPATAQIDEKARDFISKAHESAQHLGRLFQDLLDVTRAEDGRLSNNPKAVDIVMFTHDVVQGLRPKADEKGIRLIYKPQPDDDHSNERRLNPVFYVDVDNDHLREILANLVENAIKYTPRGTVIVDISGDNERVTVSITDSGIGIPTEDMVHLFQKFYRVDNTDTREIGGTGLGLYLCRRLAESMNGRVLVESQYKKGSTFSLELPRITNDEAMRSIEATKAQSQVTTPTTTSPLPISTPQVPPTTFVSAPTPPPLPTPHPDVLTPSAPVNTPLSNIEQHPEQYVRNRSDSVSVPPRNQN